MDVTMLVLSSAITFRSLLLSADSLLETWVIEGINPLKLLSTPARKSEWPTGTVIEQLIWSVKITYYSLSSVSATRVSLKCCGCHDVPWASIIRVFLCTCWHAEGQEATKSARTSQMLRSGPGGPGLGWVCWPMLTTQFRHFYSSLLTLRPPRLSGTRHRHCPSNAMSKFFLSFLKMKFLEDQ